MDIADRIYALLANTDPVHRRAVLKFAEDRLAEDARAVEAAQHAGPKATFWCLDGKAPGDDFTGADLAELMREFDAGQFEVVEASGMAVVEQRFLVWVPVDGGWEPESFPTRVEAEGYAARWKAEASKPPSPRRPDDMEDAEHAEFMAWWKEVAKRGGWVDEEDEKNTDSVTWLLRFRSKMTPDGAINDADLIPF